MLWKQAGCHTSNVSENKIFNIRRVPKKKPSMSFWVFDEARKKNTTGGSPLPVFSFAILSSPKPYFPWLDTSLCFKTAFVISCETVHGKCLPIIETTKWADGIVHSSPLFSPFNPAYLQVLYRLKQASKMNIKWNKIRAKYKECCVLIWW